MNKNLKFLVVILLLTAHTHAVRASDNEDWSNLSNSDVSSLDIDNCFDDALLSTSSVHNNLSCSHNITVNVNNSGRSKKRKQSTNSHVCLDDEDIFLFDFDDSCDLDNNYKPARSSSIVELATKMGAQHERINKRISELELAIASSYRIKYKDQNTRINNLEQLVKDLTNRIYSDEKMLHDNIKNQIILDRNMKILAHNSIQGTVKLDEAIRVLVNMMQYLDKANDNQDKKFKEFEQTVKDQTQKIKDQAEVIAKIENSVVYVQNKDTQTQNLDF